MFKGEWEVKSEKNDGVKVFASRPTEYENVHRIIFPASMKRKDVEKYVEDRRWFSYHPDGYGGALLPHDKQEGKEWEWHCANSCD